MRAARAAHSVDAPVDGTALPRVLSVLGPVTALPAFCAAAPPRVFLACGATDVRKLFDGLAVLVQQVLKDDAYLSAIFAFRGKRGDLVKLLWCDGLGLCLFTKRMDRGGLSGQ